MRTALGNANANRPKGAVDGAINAWTIDANDQIFTADEYRPLIVAYRNGAPVRLGDVGDGARTPSRTSATSGLSNGKPAVLIIIFRQPGANIIETVDRVRAAAAAAAGSIPPAIDVERGHGPHHHHPRLGARRRDHAADFHRAGDPGGVRCSCATSAPRIIPSVAVPLSLVGTFGVMYLLGYSLDNLSLMALTISTGFVVDDAIVVIENITRYIEEGMPPVAGRVERRARDRLHRALHEHFAGGGLHSDPADGRHCRPPVPRVRGHAERGHRRLAGRLADHHADDVREISALRRTRRSTAASIASANAMFDATARAATAAR